MEGKLDAHVQPDEKRLGASKLSPFSHLHLA